MLRLAGALEADPYWDRGKRKGADRFPSSQLSCKTPSGSLFDATLLPFPFADLSVSCGTIDELLSSVEIWACR